MFAVLGDILFEVIGSPETFESMREYDFAEHRVLEGRPRLQWLGNGLERLKLEIMLHSSFTDPSAQLSLLRSTAAAHRALPLVFGNGGFRGFFVIHSMAFRTHQSSALGTPIAINVTLSLKEWVTTDGPEILAAPAPLIAPAENSKSAGAEGVSALLQLRAASGATGPALQAGDVAVNAIVRSAAR
ncbi:MAG: phage tail protein [Candidatus Binatus sp.]|uniref:phage tail protein n=1 Tax=Candidatus Binatus sp. TaxID=2811406 RepID=UPI00272374E4|nr:phage tail protein [Candidatus Binatus sp.]MDO8433508.1 phage tail protein [Candidatus Binatus sp.]